MSQPGLKEADDLITRGHELWKKGRISGAFACQAASMSIKRRIERECDYKVALTSFGLEVQHQRDKKEAERLYQEAYHNYIKANPQFISSK